MRPHVTNRLFVLLMILIINSLHTTPISAQNGKEQNKLTPQDPRYELKLTLDEFSVLSSSLADGIERFGGFVDFHLGIAQVEEQVVWTIQSDDASLLEIIEHRLAWKSADFVKTVDLDNLDADSKLTLKGMKSLLAKVEDSKKNPIWNLVKISGMIMRADEDWHLLVDQGQYKLTGNSLSALGQNATDRFIVHGYLKEMNEIEVVRFQPVKQNTLELFVMSQCPFGQNAEIALTDLLDNYAGDSKPRLEVRFIFYEQHDGDKKIYASLHGEEELRENLVQIVIRDQFQQFSYKYLKRRVHSDKPWQEIAKEVGMSKKQIEKTEQIIHQDRDALIQAEYNYATNEYGIYDGSPTYVWESERIENIQDVKVFQDITVTSEGCAN